MTNYGPVPGPAGPPPGSPPPWYGDAPAYGTPAGYDQRPEPGFDPKSVHPLDWIAMGGGMLALIFSFFAYYSYRPTFAESSGECAHPGGVPGAARGVLDDLCNGADAGAWHGFFGWFGVLLGLLAAGLVAFAVFVPAANPPGRARFLAVGAAGLGVLSTLIALAVVPDFPELKDFTASVGGSYSSSAYDKSISNGHGFSYWMVLILLLVITTVSLLRIRNGDAQSAGSARQAAGHGYPAPGQHAAPPAPPPPPGQWAGPP
jgi:hypothetical protein